MLGFVAIGVSSEQTMSSPDLYGFGIHRQCVRHFIHCQHATLSQSIEAGTKGIVFLNPCDVTCRVARRCNFAELMGVQQPIDSAHDL